MSIGASYYKDDRRKILGADMLSGVILSLSYGKCPVEPKLYLYDDFPEKLVIDWDAFSCLIDQLSFKMDIELKPLTLGSTKQYLRALKKGFRANRNGILPPINVVLDEDEMQLHIPRRSYDEDVKRYGSDLPTWIFNHVVSTERKY